MASVNFLYRSTKKNAALNLRLLYRHNNIDYVIGAKTKVFVSKLYWTKYHNQKSPKDIDVKNQQTDINNKLNEIENFIISAFNQTDVNSVDKTWLVELIDLFYNPKKDTVSPPNGLLPYFDFYLEERKNELANQTLKNLAVVKGLVERYQSSIGRTINVMDVDMMFKNSFEDYCIKQGYSNNTVARALHTIKGICRHAKYNGIETSIQLDKIKPKENKVNKIHLTVGELEKLEKMGEEKLSEHLINARDWLIISCYTGQRVSDFMRFSRNDIRIEKGASLIEFTQKKTKKVMTVPLHPKVKEILEKRGGDFPRPISSQKYNRYIKKVCEIGEINEKVKGSKLVETEIESKFPYRKETGLYKKWELVTSHIGRRSFATNFYGQIPTSFLIYITGHSTEQMFLQYLGKSNKDLALEITKYF